MPLRSLHALLLRGPRRSSACSPAAAPAPTCRILPRHDATVPPPSRCKGYRFHAQTFGQAGKACADRAARRPRRRLPPCWACSPLADDYLVLFYDQRGSSLSPRVPVQEISLDGYLADLDAFVDHIGQGRAVHLLGPPGAPCWPSAYTGRHPGRCGAWCRWPARLSRQRLAGPPAAGRLAELDRRLGHGPRLAAAVDRGGRATPMRGAISCWAR